LCYLAFGVFWLVLGAAGGSFQGWHLALGGAWLALAAAHFVLAAIRKKRHLVVTIHWSRSPRQ